MTLHYPITRQQQQQQLLGARIIDRLFPGDIFWMNVFGDLEDLEQVFAAELGIKREPTSVTGHVLGSGHCSALIKVNEASSLYSIHHLLGDRHGSSVC
jgi:hypothetical protein